jgi:S-adenosylmethionine:tRNA ribosyltransferase-isomerase
MNLPNTLEAFDFNLPSELIAERPASPRDHSKLLVYHEAENRIEHRHFYEIQHYLAEGDTLFFNNSKVFPSRLFGTKESGGKAEVLLIEPREIEGKFLVMLRSNGKKNRSDKFNFQGLIFEVVDNLDQGLFWVKSSWNELEVLNHFFQKGMLAIPPYIRKGLSDETDKEDYQTVYAEKEGSVAAPTAGLHFTSELLKKITNQGVITESVTLHVGPGTFLPVESFDITEHKMHAEFFEFSFDTWQRLKNPKGKKIAIGTTTLRVLESNFWEYKKSGLTDIYLHPGKAIHSIDGLLTNFHLPKSSLFILVSALIGLEKAQEIYQVAIEKKYRFFSYGDAMLILRKNKG